MNKIFIKRLLSATLGASFIAVGIGFMSNGMIGSDSLTIFCEALTDKIGLTVGRWVFIVGIVMVIVPLVLDRKKIGYTTVFYILIGQFIVDGTMAILPVQDNLFMGTVYVLISIVIISLGTIFCLSGDLGLSYYDAFGWSITDHFKLKYVIVRYSIDGFFLIVGLLMGGRVGIGTVMCFVLFAPVVNLFKKTLYEPIRKIVHKK